MGKWLVDSKMYLTEDLLFNIDIPSMSRVMSLATCELTICAREPQLTKSCKLEDTQTPQLTHS